MAGQTPIIIDALGRPQRVTLDRSDLTGFSRVAITPFQTGPLAALTGLYHGSIIISKGCGLVSVGADFPCWIRLYGTDAARANDSARAKGTALPSGNGLFLEAATSASIFSIALSVPPLFFNGDNIPADVGYLAIQNLDSAIRDITFNLTFLPLEN